MAEDKNHQKTSDNHGYFMVEVFPKLGSSFTPIKGEIKFNFQRRKCFLIVEKKAIKLKITKASRGWQMIPKYNPAYLFIEGNQLKDNLFVLTERICDILSLSTKNHIAYFSSRIDEYSYISSWGFRKLPPSFIPSQNLTHRDSNSEFLDLNLLSQVNKKIETSNKYRDRIFASLHMNRLAKYKAFSHITEAVTDCVNSVEALYMLEDRNRQDKIDMEIFNQKKLGKTKALRVFLKKHYPGDQNDLKILEEIQPYKIRSAYLHRGILLEPASGNLSFFTKDLKKVEKLLTYNEFYRIIFFSILNFIVNYS